MHPQQVLFLCTGNSCRSQMAEAIVNHDLAGRWLASSAGTNPAGYVHPLAVQALAEIGIEHTGTSKSADLFRDTAFDQIITVCDDAAENCPLWLGKGRRTHIGFIDPAKISGSDAEMMAVFRQVRDQIRIQVIEYLQAQSHSSNHS